MEALFSKDYALLWMLALALALFLPVRHLIWVMYVRRATRRGEPADVAETRRLKKRAGITAALICLVFSFFYANYLLKGSP